MDFLVVGAGFAGCVCAERLANAGHSVIVVDRRSHIGGNAYDSVDAHGIVVHPYGPHVFHTNSRRIFKYLSRFTEWRFYEHRVLANIDGTTYPFPINRTTINKFYNLNLTEQEVPHFLDTIREPKASLRTSEDVVLNGVGAALCNAFFRGYTRKQWDQDLSELLVGVAARIPVRDNEDDRYFDDVFQFMPAQGYHALFLRMLDHPKIDIRLETDFFTNCDAVKRRHTIFTGSIDAYYGYRFGRLPYRSIRFEHFHLPDTGYTQPVGVFNFPSLNIPYTRITEFKHLTGQVHRGSSLTKEHPCWGGDPYYPVPRLENELLYKRYAALAAFDSSVSFVGRLAQYRYYNMDQVVGAALQTSARLLGQTPDIA